MELVVHDPGLGEVRPEALGLRLPHVHADGLDGPAPPRGQGLGEEVRSKVSGFSSTPAQRGSRVSGLLRGDTLYKWPHRDDRVRSNPEEVRWALQMCRLLTREVATPDEYRKVIGLR